MAAKNKVKKVPQQNVSTNKRVKSNIDEGKLQRHHVGKPSWRFSTADKGGEFCWPDDPDLLIDLLIKLSNFDSMSWNEIERGKSHYLKEGNLSRSAIKRLEELEKDDFIESLYSFRLSGIKRVIGIRYNDHVNLLWYDPEHRVCVSELKHT